MKLAAGAPTHWHVTLVDGSVVDVWADSVEGLSGPEDLRDYTFASLMEIEPQDQEDFDITGSTPTNVNRVIVTVARFPRASVRDINSA